MTDQNQNGSKWTDQSGNVSQNTALSRHGALEIFPETVKLSEKLRHLYTEFYNSYNPYYVSPLRILFASLPCLLPCLWDLPIFHLYSQPTPSSDSTDFRLPDVVFGESGHQRKFLLGVAQGLLRSEHRTREPRREIGRSRREN